MKSLQMISNQRLKELGVNLELSHNLFSLSNSAIDKDTIVFCNTGWYVGGIERVLTTLLPVLSEKYHIIMISVTDSIHEGYALPEEVPFIAFSGMARERFVERLVSLCEELSVKVFVGHANLMDPFMEAFYALRERKIRTVILNHYNYLLPYRYEWGLSIAEYRQRAFAHADVILWLNSFDAALCAFRWKNVGVMSNPIVIDAEYKREYPKTKKILAVGRFNDLNKRVDRMIEIFAGVHAKDPDTKLVLVGPYDLQLQLPNRNNVTLKKYIETLQLPEDIISFEGLQRDTKPYYLDASMVIVTSESEGFCMVLCEAGKYGIPAIVYDFDGQEIIQDGVNGYVIEPDDVNTAVERSLQILNQPALWLDMSRKASQNIQRYSIENIGEKWDRLLSSLIYCEHKTEYEHVISAGLQMEVSSDLYKNIAKSEEHILKIRFNEKTNNTTDLINNENGMSTKVSILRRAYRKAKRLARLFLSKLNGLFYRR